MKRLFILLPFALLATACHDEAPANGNSPTEEVVDAISTDRVTPADPPKDSTSIVAGEHENGNNSPRKGDEKMRLVVSFISQGEGIDRKTNDAFVTWVKQKGNITYDANNWGREGEINYCFALDNLSPAEQDKFVEEARAQLNGRPLVKFNENSSCENWK